MNGLAADIWAAMDEMGELAKRHQMVFAKVATKINDKGELVIALILPGNYAQEWKAANEAPAREGKRDARLRRG